MSTEFVNDVQIDEVVKKKAEEPLRYKVVLLNDDQTPVEWVIKVLVDIFKHTNDTAEKITLTIHNEGSGIAGIYTYEIAEQKVIESTTESRNHGSPLQIKLEEE